MAAADASPTPPELSGVMEGFDAEIISAVLMRAKNRFVKLSAIDIVVFDKSTLDRLVAAAILELCNSRMRIEYVNELPRSLVDNVASYAGKKVLFLGSMFKNKHTFDTMKRVCRLLISLNDDSYGKQTPTMLETRGLYDIRGINISRAAWFLAHAEHVVPPRLRGANEDIMELLSVPMHDYSVDGISAHKFCVNAIAMADEQKSETERKGMITRLLFCRRGGEFWSDIEAREDWKEIEAFKELCASIVELELDKKNNKQLFVVDAIGLEDRFPKFPKVVRALHWMTCVLENTVKLNTIGHMDTTKVFVVVGEDADWYATQHDGEFIKDAAVPHTVYREKVVV